MAELHDAVAGFDRAADEYERGRPEYPTAAIEFLASNLPIDGTTTVVEMASGTGKLTRAIARTGPRRLIAIEPTVGMRRVFRRMLPDVSLVAGTAERIPIVKGGADVVVVGQAFHWFVADRALAEIARVLRPGGALALLWNMRDQSVPWVARLGEILKEHEAKEAPKGRDHAWKPVLAASPKFTPLAMREFRHAPMIDPAGLMDRVLSVSFVALLPPHAKRAVEEQVRVLLASDPALHGRDRFEFPYRTEVYWTRTR
ncbi:MAG: class I SAM-dependent methyltransferase [Thermoplasmata archaeon]|nr:class I SAM-dependent methyltransferase [Thermoplasmata archaeon]